MKTASKGMDVKMTQLELIPENSKIVHYFDRNGALRSGRWVRRVESGVNQGAVIVSDYSGHEVIAHQIRNIE